MFQQQVEEALHRFVLARKARQLYPRENATVREALDRFVESVKVLFEGDDAKNPERGVYVGLTRDGFRLDGEPIATRFSGVAPLALELYRQGFKMLWLRPSATQQELGDFLDALCTKGTDASIAEALAGLSFEGIGLERVDSVRLVLGKGGGRNMDMLDYLRERQVRRDRRGIQEAFALDDTEDVSDLASFFLEVTRGSDEHEEYLFNTLTDPHRLAETLVYVTGLRTEAPKQAEGVSMNVLRQTLRHISDHLRSLPDDLRVHIAKNIADALQRTDASTRGRVMDDTIAPILGQDPMGAELTQGFSDEHIAALVSSHAVLHEGTANTISNFLHDFSSDPARREKIKRLAARNLASLDEERLTEIVHFLERSETAELPEFPRAESQSRIMGQPWTREREALARELRPLREELEALQKNVQAALSHSNREAFLLICFHLLSNETIDALPEPLSERLHEDLDAALDKQHYDFLLRIWELWAEHHEEEAWSKLRSAVWPSVGRFSSKENLQRVYREMYGLDPESNDYERLLRLLNLVPRQAIPMLFSQIATERDRAFRQFLLRLFLGFGDKTVVFLSRNIDQKDWFITRNVAYLLGQLKSEAGVPALLDVLHHDDMRVRQEVLLALAEIGGTDAEDILIGCLDDGEVLLRAVAAECLGNMGVERALPKIIEVLTSKEGGLVGRPRLAPGVIRAIGRLGGADELAVIQDFFNETEGRHPADLTNAYEEAVAQLSGHPAARAHRVPGAAKE